VLPVAERLIRLARGALRVVVVFDGADEEAEPRMPGGRLAVRFSAGRIADDEIVDLARNTPGPVVVISDDRAVRERAERTGAVALWSRALAEWAGTR